MRLGTTDFHAFQSDVLLSNLCNSCNINENDMGSF